MRASKNDKRVNLRLVLGVGMALLGCGAVAAATRPAWRAVFQPESRLAAKPAVSAPPAPAQNAQVSPVKPRFAAARPAPAPPAPMPMTPAPAPVVSQLEPETKMEGALELEAGMLPPTADELVEENDRLMAAFYESLLAGDAECCEAIVGMLNGDRWSAPRITEFRGARLATATGAIEMEGGLWQAEVEGVPLMLDLFAERVDGIGEAEVILTATVDGHLLEGQDLVYTLEAPMLGDVPLIPRGAIMLRVTPTPASSPQPKP